MRNPKCTRMFPSAHGSIRHYKLNPDAAGGPASLYTSPGVCVLISPWTDHRDIPRSEAAALLIEYRAFLRD